MNQTPEERREEVLKRRQENLLQMTIRYLARMGKSSAEAYKNTR